LVQIERVVTNSHRGNLDIIADILDASHGGAKKTYLMYRCNLSFKQMKGYSRYLIGNGLLHLVFQAAESDVGLFEVTNKGKDFLKAYKGLKALLK
jgi:predicted transcriptional regulator